MQDANRNQNEKSIKKTRMDQLPIRGFTNVYEKEHIKALNSIADALNNISHQIKYLGAGDHASPQGALEYAAEQIREGLTELSNSIDSTKADLVATAESIQHHLVNR